MMVGDGEPSELPTAEEGELTAFSTGDGIRLVVWDLDETFWDGTLDEDEAGSLPRLVPEHVAIVRALAQRGIASTVCSRNDPDMARRVLEHLGVWDLFVLATISWTEPKGDAVRRTLSALSVAPNQALFVDDNATCRAEARACSRGLLTMHPKLWRGAQPLQWGRDDGGRRVQQLRAVVRRKACAHAADRTTDGRRAFLRSCGVHVRLAQVASLDDVRWDRLLELVQRTNRLNWTKRRRSWHWELWEQDTDLTRLELRS